MTKIKPFIIVIGAGIVIFALIIIMASVLRNKPNYHTAKQEVSHKQTQQPQQWPLLWGPPSQECDKRKPELTASPITPSEITAVQPMGELAEGHVVPGEHIGINYTPNPATEGVKVYAPADGYIATVERHQYVPEKGFTNKLRNYHVYLVHGCSLFTGFVHVTNLAPEILASHPELKSLDEATIDSSSKNAFPNLAVKAGQQIGTANGFGLLGMVTVDLNKKISGYVNPENYRDESWRLNSVAPFDYFPQAIKDQLLAKNLRKTEPRGGRFDLDIDGKLLGSWFEKGSGGIKGSGAGLKRCGNFPCPAQDGQISFVYDYIDPSQLRVSIGHKWGLASQTPYGVKTNTPDFKTISQESGLVKYELAPLLNKNKDYDILEEHAIATATDESKLLGTLLVQMTGPRQIKIEIFPSKSAAQITGFSENARTYER